MPTIKLPMSWFYNFIGQFHRATKLHPQKFIIIIIIINEYLEAGLTASISV